MNAPSTRRPPSLGSGLAPSAAIVVLGLLAGGLVTRLADRDASLWRWPFHAMMHFTDRGNALAARVIAAALASGKE